MQPRNLNPVTGPLRWIWHRPALMVFVLAFLSPDSGAAVICRWVDADGRTQMADAVPDRYHLSATCTDSQRFELTPDQRREAEQRASDQASRARGALADPPEAVTPPAPAPTAPPANARRPAEAVTDATDCPTWWRLYDESSACFGPYRTVRGGLKPEAFDRCNEVPSPVPRCGPRSQ